MVNLDNIKKSREGLNMSAGTDLRISMMKAWRRLAF